MSTKIKGHRIEEKAIENKHLSDGLKLQEGTKVELNYPTHDNSNDLSRTQYQVLTQGGNADSYHYHTGGGGGEAGIYTHPQIDAALLKIMMELNSIKYGIKNSIVDLLDDDSGIDYGKLPVIIDEAKVTETSETTLIEYDKIYHYLVTDKTNQGWTGLSSVQRVSTGPNNGLFKKVNLAIRLDTDTIGVKIFRAKSTIDFQYSSERKLNLLYSPEGLKYDVITKDKARMENAALRMYIVGSTTNLTKDIALPANGAKVSTTYLLNTVYQGVGVLPVYGFTNADSTNLPSQMSIQWSANPAYIPLDYIVEYTTDAIPDLNKDAGWKPLKDLRLLDDFTPVNSLTDGTITNGAVAGNTRQINKFSFAQIPGLTGLRVRITRQISGCEMMYLNVWHFGVSDGQKVYQDLNRVIDIRPYKTLAVEVNPGKLPPEVLSLGLIAENDTGTINSVSAIWNNVVNNTTISGQTNRAIRETINIGTSTHSAYNKIRLRFRRHSGTIKISNLTIALTTSHDVASVAYPLTMRRGTFNNGQSFYEGVDTIFTTDWIHFDFPITSYSNIIISYVLEGGTIYIHNNGNRFMWYKDNNIFNDVYNTDGAGWVGWQNDYGAVEYVEIGKGYGVVNPQRLPSGNLEIPFKHYINMRGISQNMNNLKKLAYTIGRPQFSDAIDVSDIKFCNIIDVLKEPGMLSAATAITTFSGSNVTNTYNADNIGSYYQSNLVPTIIKPESVMYKFNSDQLIDKIRIMNNHGAGYRLENYKVQFTVDNTAVVGDPHDSTKWADMPGFRFSAILNSQFTGSINGANVVNNNLYDKYLDHEFTPVIAKAIRIIVFKTGDNQLLRINEVQILTADEIGDYELIHENYGTSLPSIYNFEDKGAPGTLIARNNLPKENTSGSYNVVYDKQNSLIKVFDKTKPGVIVTRTVDTDLMMHFMLNTQEIIEDKVNDKIEYEITNDDGKTWVRVNRLESVQTLVNPGELVRLRFKLYNNAKLNAYSLLYTL